MIGQAEPLVYNAKQLAEALGVNEKAAYALLHRDGFPAIQIGTRLLAPRRAVEDWLEQQAGAASLEQSS